MQRKKNFITVLCLILILGISLPISEAYSAFEFVKVGTDQINIRKGPGLSYPIVAEAKKDEQFTFLSEKEEWLEIRLANGEKGWVANWLVTKGSNGKTTSKDTTSTSIKLAIVTNNGLRVRKGPDTSFPVIGTVQKGESFPIITTNGNWLQLKTSYGDGWVSKDFIELTSSETKNTNTNTNAATGKITTDTLNVRTGPSLDSSIIGKLHRNDTVEIISQNNEWTEISHLGSNAWISSEFIQAVGSNTMNKDNEVKQPPIAGKIGTVTATSLTVRNAGSLNGKTISQISKGQSFKIIEEVNDWVKIEYKKGSFGWVASWYLDKTGENDRKATEQSVKNSSVTILHDGTNIRKSAGTQSEVIERADQGESFKIISIENDWYEIKLTNGNSGFIAGWIVSVEGSAPKVEKPGADQYLQNKKIIIDPGHGGRDNGTTGASGTIEKGLTLQTAQHIYNKLKAAGANVILTRSNDTYIPLASRVYSAQYNQADAFISIHYDSADDRSVRGLTTYYYHPNQKKLAENVHSAVIPMANLKDRGYRSEDYYVLRENNRSAILMELGYLSNPAEEMLISSNHYQETIAAGITQGLARYFK